MALRVVKQGKAKEGALTVVTWRDAHAMDGWQSATDIAAVKNPLFLTIGLLMRWDEGVVVIASTVPCQVDTVPGQTLERKYNDVSVIPVEMVVKVEQ
jgi:hypothetical protein